MKTNELMIGDWVNCPKLKCDEDDGNMRIKQLYCADLDCDSFKELKYSEIEPIPLTPEILEKNGFKKYNGYGYASNKGYCFEGFYINYDFTTRIANIDCKFNYVHELQHALKLCHIEKTIEL